MYVVLQLVLFVQSIELDEPKMVCIMPMFIVLKINKSGFVCLRNHRVNIYLKKKLATFF